MPERGNDGLKDAVVQQRRAGCDACGQPVPALPCALCEQPAHAELVGQRGSGGGVGQQVHRVPELVRKAPADSHQGRHHNGDEQRHGNKGQPHVRHQHPEGHGFADGIQPFGHPVADGDQDPVPQQEVERRLPELPVEFQGAVVADGLVDERNPGRQQQHQEDQVHAGQPGHNAQSGEGSGGCRESCCAAVGQPQCHSGCNGCPGSRCQQVGAEQATAVRGRESSPPLAGAVGPGGQSRQELCVHASTLRPDPFILL
ncbi:hypothetical protein D9M72_369390 [compost metagenome]